MNMLILGGTAFVGRTFVGAALKRGHDLTLFNRGKRNSALFPELERIQGDRETDLDKLAGREWDAVFDTSGYLPRIVGLSVDALQNRIGRYLFISSISAYKDFGKPNQNEESELASWDGPIPEEITGETYGPLKVQCEQAVQAGFGERALIVRPGLIVGPNDPTDRFTYWPVRMSRGGEVLVPDRKEQPAQVIDVRDLADWCLQMLEVQASGVFNATGPQTPYRLGEVLGACAENTYATLTWASPEFLKVQEVKPWSDLPLALDLDGSSDGLCQIDVSKALNAGLTLRPLDETIRDTKVWAATRPPDHPWRAGLTPEREAELLGLL